MRKMRNCILSYSPVIVYDIKIKEKISNKNGLQWNRHFHLGNSKEVKCAN